MEADTKLGKLLKTGRGPQEIQDWIFSLTPLGVAFIFFFVFMLTMDMPGKDMILVTGFAAGFTGLQSYWIFRGWRKNHGITVLLGVIGIAVTFGLVWLYMSFT
jgi:uncharacterized membrane protein